MPDTYDVLILGAGPAGSSLATRLGRAGFRVALADRKRFPRAKPCGEFLSPQCLPILGELGVLDTLESLGARRVAGMRMFGYARNAVGHFRDVGGSALPHAGEGAGGLAVRREVLDHELVRAAEATPGVELFERHAARALLRDADGRVQGASLVDHDGTEHELKARWTIGADGIRSVVARELGVQRKLPWLDKFALTARFAGVTALPTAEVHIFEGGYFAAAPVDGDLLSVNLIVDRVRLADRTGDWDDYFARHLAAVPEFAERLCGARRVGPVHGIGPLACTTTAQTADGAALVGDACGYIDPITGEGIYFALRGAELLAAELATALHAARCDARALRGYVRGRRLEVAPRLWFSTLLQRGLRSRAVTRSVLGAMQSRPRLADLMVSFTGDYVRYRELLRPGLWLRAALGGAGGGR